MNNDSDNDNESDRVIFCDTHDNPSQIWNSNHDIYEADMTDRWWHQTAFAIPCNQCLVVPEKIPLASKP